MVEAFHKLIIPCLIYEYMYSQLPNPRPRSAKNPKITHATKMMAVLHAAAVVTPVLRSWLCVIMPVLARLATPLVTTVLTTPAGLLVLMVVLPVAPKLVDLSSTVLRLSISRSTSRANRMLRLRWSNKGWCCDHLSWRNFPISLHLLRHSELTRQSSSSCLVLVLPLVTTRLICLVYIICQFRRRILIEVVEI
jgi:hypothetical protein